MQSLLSTIISIITLEQLCFFRAAFTELLSAATQGIELLCSYRSNLGTETFQRLDVQFQIFINIAKVKIDFLDHDAASIELGKLKSSTAEFQELGALINWGEKRLSTLVHTSSRAGSNRIIERHEPRN